MISSEEIGVVFDADGNRRHKDATFIAKVGNKFLGYFVSQEFADNTIENYKRQFFAELDALEKEAQAHEKMILESHKKIISAKRVVADLREKTRKLEKNASKPLRFYKARLEEAHEWFPDEMARRDSGAARDSDDI